MVSSNPPVADLISERCYYLLTDMAEYITDRSGKIVGRMEEDKVYDRAGKLVGRFNRSENSTFDRGGKYIGRGDKRVQLIKEA